MNRRKAAGICFIFLGIGLAVVVGKWEFGKPLVSPLSEIRGQGSGVSNWGSQIGDGDKKIVMGFLPYWNLKYEPTIQYGKLTHVAFFGLNVGSDGSIQKREKAGNLEPGWTAYRSAKMGEIVRKAHDREAKVILVLRAFDNEVIESVLSSPARREKLIGETLEAIKTKNLDGVNIDFEYVGSPPDSVKNEFVEFVKKFRSSCDLSLATCHLSIDAYADAATENRLWNLSDLEPFVDGVVMMAYDFSRPSSDYSGPVAPLHKIKASLQAYSKQLPLRKVLLGVAYYGYEWPTYSPIPVSKTAGKGYLATYRRIQQMILGESVSLGWDNESFTPYLISTSSGTTSQIFYDDSRSLALKYDLANEAGLGGVGIWALGYDGNRPELWELLGIKF